MRFVLNLLLAYAAQQWKNCGITQNRIQHQNFRPQAALQHMQYFCAGINDCACLNGIIGFCIQADHLALGCITVCKQCGHTFDQLFFRHSCFSYRGKASHTVPLHFNILSQFLAAHLVQVLSSLRSALQPAPLCSNQPAHLRPGWALRCFRISIATGSGRGTPYLRGRYNAQRGPPPRSPKYAAPSHIATGYNTHAFPPVILQCN